MKTIPFSIEEWRKDETRRVIDEDGTPVEIVKCGLSPEFFCHLPKGVNPQDCYTYHAHRQGSNAYPVIGCGVIASLHIVEN